MSNPFEEYNKQFGESSTQKVYAARTWIICPTDKHSEGVNVWWNPETNRLAVFSNTWPHDGLMEYPDRESNELVFKREHAPWQMPLGFIFIGEL